MNHASIGEAIVRMDEAADLLHRLRHPIRQLEEFGGNAADVYNAYSWDEFEKEVKDMGDALEEAGGKLRRCVLEDDPA